MLRTVLLSSAAIAAFPASAQAQENPVKTAATDAVPPSTATTDGSHHRDGIADIIVTARRRSESLQRVPIAVSVVSQEQLEQHQVTDAFQLVNLTPSLQVQSANQQVGPVNFTIRGIGTTIFGPQIESSVGIVVDDVAMSRPQFGNVQFFDLERVEVLRGPQGMLFGKNASAGLVNIVTTKPKLGTTEFLVNLDYGNSSAPGHGNQGQVNAAVNLPIGATAALRVAGFVSRQDGFVTNVHRKEDLGLTKFGGRAKLLWQPAADVSLTFAGDYQLADGPGESVLVRDYTAPGGFIDRFTRADGIVASQRNVFVSNDVPTRNEFRVYGTSVKAEIGLGDAFTLSNIAAFRGYASDTSIDTDTTSFNLFDVNTGGLRYRQFTEELRLSSSGSGPLSFQTGLFYLNLRARFFLLQGGSFGAPHPTGVSLAGVNYDTSAHNESYAAFFEGTYNLTQDIRVTGGVRYTHDELEVERLVTNPAALIPLFPPVNLARKAGNDNISYRVGLDYNLTPSVLAYATYSRGYKGPTFDLFGGSPVKPEIPKTFEIGIKSTLFGRRLRLNLALFDTKFLNYQTQAQAPGTASNFIVLNAGQLKSRGAEAEYTLVPLDGLTISGGVTYNATRYVNLRGIPCYFGQPIGGLGTNVCSVGGTTDVSGNQLANAPRWTTSTTLRYEHSVGNAWQVFGQADAYTRSSFYFTQTRDPRLKVTETAIVGAAIGARNADAGLTVSLFVRNLFDKRVPGYLLADPVSNVYRGPAGVTDASLGGNYWHSFGSNSFRTVGISINYAM